MDFRCTECDYDENLMLVVKDGVTHRFNIDSDGKLDHYDSDGDGQEIYLECQGCGEKYIFSDFIPLVLEEKFVLNTITANCETEQADITELKFEKVTPCP